MRVEDREIKNIIDMLREILSGRVKYEKRDDYDLRMKRVFEIEKECGATEGIQSLTKDFQNHDQKQKTNRKNIINGVMVEKSQGTENIVADMTQNTENMMSDLRKILKKGDVQAEQGTGKSRDD